MSFCKIAAWSVHHGTAVSPSVCGRMDVPPRCSLAARFAWNMAMVTPPTEHLQSVKTLADHARRHSNQYSLTWQVWMLRLY